MVDIDALTKSQEEARKRVEAAKKMNDLVKEARELRELRKIEELLNQFNPPRVGLEGK